MLVRKKGTAEHIPVMMTGASKVSKQITVGRADGTPAYSMRIFTVEPGGHTPFHSHPFDHVNFVVSGSGVLVSAGGQTPVEAGDSALVLPDEMHQYRNTGSEPFVFICFVDKAYE